MATARKTPEPDPLVQELPPEPAPSSAADIEFQVTITPQLISGAVKWVYEISDHNAKQHVGDYTGLKEVIAFDSVAQAEHSARRRIEQIRKAIDLKLNMPLAVKITL